MEDLRAIYSDVRDGKKKWHEIMKEVRRARSTDDTQSAASPSQHSVTQEQQRPPSAPPTLATESDGSKSELSERQQAVVKAARGFWGESWEPELNTFCTSMGIDTPLHQTPDAVCRVVLFRIDNLATK